MTVMTMSKAQEVARKLPSKRERLTPTMPTCGRRINPSMPLHQLFADRFHSGRDLKVIITAKNSSTGTGKTTLAFWLADQWQQLFADDPWCADDHATLDVYDYLEKYRNLSPGSVLILDEAEELDSRRSMAGKNVNFSHYWMKMRVRQVTTILTLPSTTALDSRLEELADVWIEVQRRGKAMVHDIRVNSYSKNVQTWQMHHVEWPDVSEHPEMEALDELKQENIDYGIEKEKEENEVPSPEEVQRQSWAEVAQNMRDDGKTLREIAKFIPRSRQWVSENTENNG